MVFLLSMFIAVAKRRDDVIKYERDNRLNRMVVKKEYSLEFLDNISTIISSTLIVSYIIFITDSDVALRYNSNSIYITLIFVLIGVFRYSQLTYVYKNSGSPIKIFYRDTFIKIVLFCWFLTFLIIIY